MSHRRRSVLEKRIQAEIEADLGSEADLLLLRNSVGKAEYSNGEAKEYHVPFGLGVGSPDLVSILRVETGIAPIGIWLCFEVKAEEGDVDPEQEKCHAIWRRFGAIVVVVRSIAEARDALEEARSIGRALFSRAA